MKGDFSVVHICALSYDGLWVKDGPLYCNTAVNFHLFSYSEST